MGIFFLMDMMISMEDYFMVLSFVCAIKIVKGLKTDIQDNVLTPLEILRCQLFVYKLYLHTFQERNAVKVKYIVLL